MSEKRIDAAALIGLSIDTLRAELQEALPPEKRYAAAMIANALEIARREFADEAREAATWALLDKAYEEGEGSLAALARDIRSGEIDDDAVAGLRALLRNLLIAELKVANPRFLASRGVASEKPRKS